jgi:hypothetical protein
VKKPSLWPVTQDFNHIMLYDALRQDHDHAESLSFTNQVKGVFLRRKSTGHLADQHDEGGLSFVQGCTAFSPLSKPHASSVVMQRTPGSQCERSRS